MFETTAASRVIARASLLELAPRGAMHFGPRLQEAFGGLDASYRGECGTALETKACPPDIPGLRQALCQRLSSTLACQIPFRRKEPG